MPRIYPIPGGIHPPQHKARSLGQPIRSAGLPDQLIIPLAQHIGAPAEPVVAVGDTVRKGQVIAKTAGFVSAPCHAPTSGHISAIGEHPVPHPSGLSGTCITLRPDGDDQWSDFQGAHNYEQMDKNSLLQVIRDAGIVGMGGAGFPTPVKLGSDKTIDTLIINGTECEPYITADDRLMQERAEDIVEGVKILRHLLAPGATVIGIEDNKPEALTRMREATEGSGIDVISFPTKYPSGGEKQLIQILTGKEVPRGGLPADIGIVLQNIGTAYAVFRAIRYSEPLITRIVTVTGDNVAHPGNYEVLIGTPIQHLLNLCGFDPGRSQRLIMGGPMMGFALTSTAVPVVKTTNCILAPSTEELPAQAAAQACIRCGMCAQACPASLLPQQLYWFAQGKEYDKLENHHLFDCIECGCCSYVCPSNIPLVQYYRASKAEITARRLETQKSEQAKLRFEARQRRLEEEQAQKEARRKARSKKAPGKAKAAKAPPKPKPAAGNAAGAATADQPAKSDDKTEQVLAALTRVHTRTEEQDPAQAAIARAQTARTSQGADSAEDKLAKLEQRLAKAQAKCAEVRSAGGDNLAAFEASVEKLQQKVDAARAAIPQTKQSTGAAPVADAAPPSESKPATSPQPQSAAKPDAVSKPKVASKARPQQSAPALSSQNTAAAQPAPKTKVKKASKVAPPSAPMATPAVKPAAAPAPESKATADATPTPAAGMKPEATPASESASNDEAAPTANNQSTPASENTGRRKMGLLSWPSKSKANAAGGETEGAAHPPQLAEQVVERLQHKLQEVRAQYEEARSEGGPRARELEAVARVMEKQMLELMQRVIPRPGPNTEQPTTTDTAPQPSGDKPATDTAKAITPAAPDAAAPDAVSPSTVAPRAATQDKAARLRTLEQRLRAARDILAEASAENSPKRDAFAQTVAHLEEQVQQARQAD